MTLREQIDSLVEWQILDLAVTAAAHRITELKDTLSALDRDITEKKVQLKDDIQALNAFRKQYRELEAQSRNYLDMMAKSNDKLRSVKTNKEYQSILKEIEETQKKHSELEDRMLEQLEVLDSMETAVSAETARLTAFETRHQEKVQETEKQIADEYRAMETLQQEMDATLADAAPETGVILARVRKKVHGMAVVPVQQAICMGCHLNIPAQLFNELLRFDEIRFCPHCHRIIYWQEKEEVQ